MAQAASAPSWTRTCTLDVTRDQATVRCDEGAPGARDRVQTVLEPSDRGVDILEVHADPRMRSWAALPAIPLPEAGCAEVAHACGMVARACVGAASVAGSGGGTGGTYAFVELRADADTWGDPPTDDDFQAVFRESAHRPFPVSEYSETFGRLPYQSCKERGGTDEACEQEAGAIAGLDGSLDCELIEVDLCHTGESVYRCTDGNRAGALPGHRYYRS